MNDKGGPRTPIVFVALQTSAQANGGLTSLVQIMRSLTRYRPILLTNLDNPRIEGWRREGIEVHVLPERASLGLKNAPMGTAAAYVAYSLAIRRILAESGARIVHANDPLAYQLVFAGIRSRPGTRLVFNVRDTLAPERKVPRSRYAWIFGTADHTFFLSRDMKARWCAVAPPGPASSSATYSVVDFDRFRRASSPQEEPKVVLVSGVVSAKKGQLRFIEQVAPRLTAANVECWFSGDFKPDSDAYCRACQVAAAGLGNQAKFLGYRDDIDHLIARASVVCVSSRYEGLMRTMIEAMAMGRPVVSTDVASAREVLEREGKPAGIVFPIDFGPEMADAILALCFDGEKSRRLGANGAQIARELFDKEAVVASYEGQYDRLMQL